MSGSQEKPRVAGEACGETVSFNQRPRVHGPRLTSIRPAQVFMSKILNPRRLPGCYSVADLALWPPGGKGNWGQGLLSNNKSHHKIIIQVWLDSGFDYRKIIMRKLQVVPFNISTVSMSYVPNTFKSVFQKCCISRLLFLAGVHMLISCDGYSEFYFHSGYNLSGKSRCDIVQLFLASFFCFPALTFCPYFLLPFGSISQWLLVMCKYLSLVLSLSVCLSLSHTHTHTHAHPEYWFLC